MVKTVTTGSTVRRRRLSAELRQLREAAGVSREEAAEQMGWSSSKVFRIESGRWVRLNPADIRHMLAAYGVTDESRVTAYLTVGKETRQQGWWTRYSDVIIGDYVGLETDASSIHTYQPLLVPGLAQTEDYARAVIHAARPKADVEEAERRVDARMKRQALLTKDEAPHFWVVVDEAVIRRQVGGPTVMRAQLERVIELSELPNVEIQVLPFTKGAHAAVDGQFVILKFAEDLDQPAVFIDSLTSGLYLEEASQVSTYELVFNHAQVAALSIEDSLSLMKQLAADFR